MQKGRGKHLWNFVTGKTDPEALLAGYLKLKIMSRGQHKMITLTRAKQSGRMRNLAKQRAAVTRLKKLDEMKIKNNVDVTPSMNQEELLRITDKKLTYPQKVILPQQAVKMAQLAVKMAQQAVKMAQLAVKMVILPQLAVKMVILPQLAVKMVILQLVVKMAQLAVKNPMMEVLRLTQKMPTNLKLNDNCMIVKIEVFITTIRIVLQE